MSSFTNTTIFQLLAAKAAIQLEAKGMKHSRGSVRLRWALHYNMLPRSTHAEVITRIDEEMATYRNQIVLPK